MPNQAPIPSIAAERCETCRFWRAGKREDNKSASVKASTRGGGWYWGDCRAHAPISAQVNAFPRSHGDDWCGEFKGIPNGD